MGAPTLTDGQVTLRAYREEDVDAVLASRTEQDFVRWTRVPVPYDRAAAAEWVASRAAPFAGGEGARVLAIEHEGRYVGDVGLRSTGGDAAEIGFGLVAGARGRGLMSRAVRLALTWAFEDLALDVVHWRAQVGNWASRRVAWACGFAVEGTVRGLVEQRGRRQDGWIGSLKAGEEMAPRTPWLDVPELAGSGVRLRRHDDQDVVRITEACSAPSTQAWLPDLPSPYSLVRAAEYVTGREEQHASGAGVYWAVADTGGDRLLGAVALSGLDAGASRSGEIGYWTHPDARGRGVMPAAVRLVARHALLDAADGGLGLARATARVAEGNTASRRVLEKSGFTFVGVDRAAERLRDGRVVDFHRYDLLASELPEAPT